MKTIYKFPLNPSRECQNIVLPLGAEMLSVIEQRGQVILYCLVDPDAEGIEVREYLITGTGWAINEEDSMRLIFIGTVKVGTFVWHFFERVTHHEKES